jgi:hypothetical protein
MDLEDSLCLNLPGKAAQPENCHGLNKNPGIPKLCEPVSFADRSSQS